MAGKPYIIIDRARLVADPETRTTKSGQQVMSLRIAVNPSTYNKQTKQWDDDEPQFYNITEWDSKRQQQYAANISKGTNVSVIGYLDINKYQTQSGEQRTENIITKAHISLLMRQPTVENTPYEQENSNMSSTSFDEAPF